MSNLRCKNCVQCGPNELAAAVASMTPEQKAVFLETLQIFTTGMTKQQILDELHDTVIPQNLMQQYILELVRADNILFPND